MARLLPSAGAVAQVELGNLDALAVDLRLAVNDGRLRAADLEVMLARADGVAAAAEADCLAAEILQ